MSRCTVSDLNERLSFGDGLILVDVREHAEYAGGRISGAVSLPLGELENRRTEIDRKGAVYLICRTGRRSLEAQKKLKSFGFENVINVEGGFEAWKKANLPFERSARAPWALERQVRFAAGVLVLTGVLSSIFVHPFFIALSGFVGAGLIFAAVTDTCAMGMLLLKMPWNSRAAPDCEIKNSELRA